jgi:uncharacterized repeat protein (TIGR03803 family)
LIQATDGNFYGTTPYGGSAGTCTYYEGCGTIFKITPSGVFTTVYSFCSEVNCPDGFAPYSGLVQGSDGNLYGTTSGGGLAFTNCFLGCGTVFKVTLSVKKIIQPQRPLPKVS